MDATAILYGLPRPDVAAAPRGAVQTSPLMPGSSALETIADAAVGEAVVLAPPGTLERDAVLAHALRALRPGGRLTALAAKDKGGARLRKVLEAFGCKVDETSRRHHRICACARPDAPTGLDAAIAAGAVRRDPNLGLWTQPGVFSWDRIDPGTALLLKHLPAMQGRGADLGCGIGLLGGKVLEATTVSSLALVDLDRRAVDAARRNVVDPRAVFAWADVRQPGALPSDLDFVVMNPPFHAAGAEDQSLGAGFIAVAAGALKRGGRCWLVANRHLPYEAPLRAAFAAVSLLAEGDGYKVYEARR
ncbi:class I SAM-dependent methyltransferase [Phenylobacterium sp.]|uniref:class I SAM-dependent methyltransferase n=1 Tax=Phenylobacterium sp. TaxID=1871053 RepID=UPI002732F17A|nr:class I SAM-dependent methyltransferase [Phenylobacterium sp.]MDP3660957.1 class I SAM-dependent methyltransferase [Phenylobacterium sp.]